MASNPTPPAQPAEQKKPLWKKKRFIIPAAIVVFFIIVGVFSGGNRQPTSESTQEPVESPAAESPSPATPPPPSTPSPPPPAPEPNVATVNLTGAGDDIRDIDLGGNPAIITFECPACTSNTVLKTNGRDSLLVNTIGAYSGSHLVDMQDTSNTTELEINADGAWTVTVADVTTAPRTAGVAQGHGDAAVFIEAQTTRAAITNTGSGNFVVYGYGGSRSELAVNEIGSYQGTVRLTLPGFVQVNSTGDWTITPG